MNLTNLFGKQVFALYEGELVGTIASATFNKQQDKIISLKLFDSEENEYELKTCYIKAVDECVLINNASVLTSFIDLPKPECMFKEAINSNAKMLGKIVDCEFNDKCEVEYYLTDKNNKLLPKFMYNRGSFVYYSDAKFKISAVKTKNINLANIKVKILNTDAKMFDNFIPSKVQFNTDALIGKVAKDDLYGLNNEVIIKANQVISKRTILDATRHNRLNQLYFLVN